MVDWLTLVSEIGKVSKKLDDNPLQKVFTILVSLDSSIFQFVLPLLVVDWLTLVSESRKLCKNLDDNPLRKG